MCPTAGHCVSQVQLIHGVRFLYQPPPRSIVPQAAGLQGRHQRPVCCASVQWGLPCSCLELFKNAVRNKPHLTSLASVQITQQFATPLHHVFCMMRMDHELGACTCRVPMQNSNENESDKGKQAQDVLAQIKQAYAAQKVASDQSPTAACYIPAHLPAKPSYQHLAPAQVNINTHVAKCTAQQCCCARIGKHTRSHAIHQATMFALCS